MLFPMQYPQDLHRVTGRCVHNKVGCAVHDPFAGTDYTSGAANTRLFKQ